MAVSDALAAAIDRFYKREFGESFTGKTKVEANQIDICCTDEVPCSRYTKEELLDLDIPEYLWNKAFLLRVYLDLLFGNGLRIIRY